VKRGKKNQTYGKGMHRNLFRGWSGWGYEENEVEDEELLDIHERLNKKLEIFKRLSHKNHSHSGKKIHPPTNK